MKDNCYRKTRNPKVTVHYILILTFVEMVPFSETEHAVQTVLLNKIIFEVLAPSKRVIQTKP